MPVNEPLNEKDQAILNVRLQGYIDTQAAPDRSENSIESSVAGLSARYPVLTPAEVRLEYITGVVEREAQVKNSGIESQYRSSTAYDEGLDLAGQREDRLRDAETQKILVEFFDKAREVDPTVPDIRKAPTWFDQEASRIQQAPDLAVPAHEIELANAYWNGRREGYNSARQFAIDHNPGLVMDLPPAIQLDEIRVRQPALEQEQDQSLSVAR
jgi:hypothetical protein